MYKIKDTITEKIEASTFSELNMKEKDIEEILRKNVEIICDEEESMLIVGSQVRNEANGISDLVAIDDKGNLVLIEIKRDKEDIVSRKESFEFQAIRYAASYATVKTEDELISKLYAPYINKFKKEFDISELTHEEFALRKLSEFLKVNDAENNFNDNQRIILVASSFDEQTLSAVSWLASNKVDISCYQLIPYLIDGSIYIKSEKILPLSQFDDFYVNLLDGKNSNKKLGKPITRRQLPKIRDMIAWGVVNEGDILIAKDFLEEKAILLKSGNVIYNEEELSLNKWLSSVYGWAAIQSYVFAVHEKSGKTLSAIREEYMEENEINL
ncbi:MAG: hypothetical protein GX079_01460 [Tissierellia bacterium]|nr:hypothetical protein [Tissierellia bacterium]